MSLTTVLSVQVNDEFPRYAWYSGEVTSEQAVAFVERVFVDFEGYDGVEVFDFNVTTFRNRAGLITCFTITLDAVSLVGGSANDWDGDGKEYEEFTVEVQVHRPNEGDVF